MFLDFVAWMMAPQRDRDRPAETIPELSSQLHWNMEAVNGRIDNTNQRLDRIDRR